MAIRLTEKFIESAKGDPKGRKEHMDALVPGLVFIVQPSSKKSWGVRYRDQQKRPVKVTLSPYPLLSLADARDQAREVLEKVARGDDPAAEKRTLKRIVFDQAPSRERDLWWTVAEDYLKRDASSLRSSDQIEAILTRETKTRWSSRPIGELTRREVISLIDGIADRGTPIAANRALAHIKRVFSWAQGRDIIAANPCVGVEKRPEVSRDRVLSRSELADVWTVSDDMPYPFGPMIQTLILTGQRLREVAEAEWREFDLPGALWEIPPDRAKNDERQLVPLSVEAASVIDSLPRLGRPARFLFTTTLETPISGFARAKQQVDERLAKLDVERGRDNGLRPAEIEPRKRWTFHDIRRTIATELAALGVSFEVTEAVLNHRGVSRGGVAAVYQRHKYDAEKREALQRWATSLDFIR
jgi:integrase